MALGLVPRPLHAEHLGEEDLAIHAGATLAYPAAIAPAARWWIRTIDEAFGVMLVPLPETDHADVVFVVDSALPVGGYLIEVGGEATSVRVTCADLAGAHAATQTLRQLAGPASFRRAPTETAGLRLPRCVIQDSPRVGWRGVHLDVARHFRTKAEVLRFIDLAAAHHLNVLHLHLTDDQGWRIEVDDYPALTKIAAWRRATTMSDRDTGTTDPRPHGGFYTRADLREIAAYAREHGIVVVPEVDVPGHSQAAITAYPHLGARQQADREVWTTWGVSDDVLDPSEQTLDFYRTVIDQVIDDMDPPYFHLGGDEVPTEAWEQNPAIVDRARELGYTAPDGTVDVGRLHGWFLSRMVEHLRGRGRRAVVWDEAFGPDLTQDVIITVWRTTQTASEAVAAGHDVVLAMVKPLYLDAPQSSSPDEPWHWGSPTRLEDVYAFEPTLPTSATNASSGGRVLGAQAQLWSEHMDTAQSVDYAAFPRLAAFAEAAWTQGLPTDRTAGTPASIEFLERLAKDHLPRLEAAGVAFRPLAGPHPWQRHPGAHGTCPEQVGAS